MKPTPTDLRATFGLFRFYRPDVGIERLLQDAGCENLVPRQIYQAVHDRPPDSLEVALPPKDFDSIWSFIDGLSSLEFQENLAARLLRAFPEKNRLFFVHIPKTAGVDLASRLISRYPSINTNLLDRNLVRTPEEVFLTIKHIVLELAGSDTVFISGHTPLGTYQSWNGNGIRYQDQVFTVVRKPIDQIVSQLNYVLTRIFADGDPVAPDTAGWRQKFAVEDQAVRESRDRILQLAHQILHHRGVVVPNVICAYLGGGSYDVAIAQTVAHDLEVIELNQLDSWAEQRWGVTRKTRLNSSEKFLSEKDLSTDDLEYARSITQDDLQYYQAVMAGLERHGGTTIRGAQIIR